ncbi:hypothetical protein CF095_09675 [Clostridium botulinum]
MKDYINRRLPEENIKKSNKINVSRVVPKDMNSKLNMKKVKGYCFCKWCPFLALKIYLDTLDVHK